LIQINFIVSGQELVLRHKKIVMTQTREIIRMGRTEVQFLLEGKDSNGQLAMF